MFKQISWNPIYNKKVINQSSITLYLMKELKDFQFIDNISNFI